MVVLELIVLGLVVLYKNGRSIKDCFFEKTDDASNDWWYLNLLDVLEKSDGFWKDL